jgi:hypothetical protein
MERPNRLGVSISLADVRGPRLSASRQTVRDHEGQFAPGRDPNRLVGVLPAADG